MGAKRAVNLSIDGDVLDEAKRNGTNVSAVLERALLAENDAKRRARWRSENRAAVSAWNDWVEENGVPFAALRPW